MVLILAIVFMVLQLAVSRVTDPPDPKDTAICGQQCGDQYKAQARIARIVQGENASPAEFPFMISIILWKGQNSSGIHNCGGAILDESWILTAAHCVNKYFCTANKTIRTAEHEMASDMRSGFEKDYVIEKIIEHPNFTIPGLRNDVALIKVKNQIHFHNLTQPIDLPSSDEDFAGQTGTVIGWGQTGNACTDDTQNVTGKLLDSPMALQKLQVPVMNHTVCEAILNVEQRNETLDDSTICAGYIVGKKDACQGDSGGPLFIQNGTQFTLVGIVSRGYGCAEPLAPGVYANVPYYVKWITETMKNHTESN